ncbi:biopolymer transporter ExbD [Bacteroidales bacterium OttesenSCG-928-B11]|nr:biopolymer transporter ExbD [Bacteroidales bacterium OttesenSCG-928-E04]MDL2309107.1 biopolymer transporter ExbD [Bacteroidales bacterium OttesenSCG-928-C03]MDL2312940.1 biopolymer transporter ExbD [Bacteroidales bacterium OttesenSCG-928-B11]MDL2326670.1 biopolymer transporter ExbD [Bacteroidales bacterium OttesenSCG-928-A14]
MARFRKDEKKEVPELNMGSMSDIIFMFLFFFMVITNMRESNIKVTVRPPSATEVQKLEKKSLVATVYIGEPVNAATENTLPPGKVSVQLNDQTIKQEDLAEEVRTWIGQEKEGRSEEDRNKLTFSLKVDKDVQMRYVNTIKSELRTNNALKINYATGKTERK